MHSSIFHFLFIEMSQTANLISQYVDESPPTVGKPALKSVLRNPLSFPLCALIPQQKRLCGSFQLKLFQSFARSGFYSRKGCELFPP